MRLLLSLFLTVAYLQATAQEADTTVHVHDHLNLNEIVITGLTGQTKMKHSPAPVQVVTADLLRQGGAQNIVDALSRQPGLSSLSTGSGVSKPVIRGLGFNRVVVMHDGVRQEGQQWGEEHGLEVDAASVATVEVLKGPASLMYGSDALAGALVMRDALPLPEGEVKANVQSEYHTNNSLFGYSANFAGHKQVFLWDVRWSQQHAGEYCNHYDGRVDGSQFSQYGARAFLGLQGGWGHTWLRLSHLRQKPGMIEGDEELDEDDDDNNLDNPEVGSPFQVIRHSKVVAEQMCRIGQGSLTAIVGAQLNRRQEYEDGALGLDFRLLTVSYSASYITSLPSQCTNLSFGLSGMTQRSENLGSEVLIPAYRQIDVGAYATASHSLSRSLSGVTISGGLRADVRLTESRPLEGRFDEFRRAFRAMTGSAGAVWNVCSHTNFRLNLSRGFRAPNISELGSNGRHEGTFRYEVGNKSLRPEKSAQIDLGADHSGQHLSAQLALFANRISDYIYLAKTSASNYTYVQSDAHLWGGEATVDVHLPAPLHFANTLSVVMARLSSGSDADRWLPQTPAHRWTTDVHCDLLRRSRTVQGCYVAVELARYFPQHHISATAGELPSRAYTLLSFSAAADICCRGHRVATLSLLLDNALNKYYQPHLSRLRYAPTSDGRGLHAMGRNMVLKVKIPIVIF